MTAAQLPARPKLVDDVALASERLDPADEWAPITALEPCEVCGADVVAVEYRGARRVVEPRSRGPATVPGRAYNLRCRPHRCRGRS